jgi:ferritin
MAMSEQLRDAFNEQIALEFSAAYTYLAMAAYFEEQNLTGMAHWMAMQHEEELVHARKFFQFMLDRDAGVHLGAIPEPKQDYGSPVEAFAAALAHEQKVSAAIHALYRTADAEGDYASMPLLSWFIDEQLEEEASVGRILDRVKLAGDNPAALLVLDREMEARGAGGDEA